MALTVFRMRGPHAQGGGRCAGAQGVPPPLHICSLSFTTWRPGRRALQPGQGSLCDKLGLFGEQKGGPGLKQREGVGEGAGPEDQTPLGTWSQLCTASARSPGNGSRLGFHVPLSQGVDRTPHRLPPSPPRHSVVSPKQTACCSLPGAGCDQAVPSRGPRRARPRLWAAGSASPSVHSTHVAWPALVLT